MFTIKKGTLLMVLPLIGMAARAENIDEHIETDEIEIVVSKEKEEATPSQGEPLTIAPPASAPRPADECNSQKVCKKACTFCHKENETCPSCAPEGVAWEKMSNFRRGAFLLAANAIGLGFTYSFSRLLCDDSNAKWVLFACTAVPMLYVSCNAYCAPHEDAGSVK